MNVTSLNFDPVPAQISVKIGDQELSLREASSDAVCKYRNFLTRAAELGPEGRPIRVHDLADAEPLFLSLCLFFVKEGGQVGSLVPITTIRGWPSRVVRALFEEAIKISGLREPETEKN